MLPDSLRGCQAWYLTNLPSGLTMGTGSRSKLGDRTRGTSAGLTIEDVGPDGVRVLLAFGPRAGYAPPGFDMKSLRVIEAARINKLSVGP